MIDRKQADAVILEALSRVAGITGAKACLDEDRQKVIEIEEEAEARSLMGLGKVVNAGVREVVACDWIYVALTSMDFDWGCRPNLLMKKDEQIVGEEVTDARKIQSLSENKNVWFMHKNFVVYKDKVSFPHDVMKKICYFEIPCNPADWCNIEKGKMSCQSIVYGSPTTPCDIFLKDHYFERVDTKGSGTILIGVKLY